MGECDISWLVKIIGSVHKTKQAIPESPENLQEEKSTPEALLAKAAAARQEAAKRIADENIHRQVLGAQAIRLKNSAELYPDRTRKLSRRNLLIAGGTIAATGLAGFLGFRALDGLGNKEWPTPVATRVPMPKPIQGDAQVFTLAQGVAMSFVRIPSGEFIMGSSDVDWGADSDEKPQHNVYLDEFLIGEFEVTVAQYRAFVESTGYAASSDSLLIGKDDYPVTMVSWDDAVAFCQWMSKVTSRTVRLPTEAEWEKAARGTDARTYPWGNEPPDKSRCNFENKVGTLPVGSYSPIGDSPYGCADMAGNVWEWVSDWYQKSYYLNSPGSNPSGPANGESRVLRGGGWYGYCYYNRAADRTYSVFPDSRSYDYGFRCAVTKQE